MLACATSEVGCTSRKKVPLGIRLKSTRLSHGRFWSRPLPREAEHDFSTGGAFERRSGRGLPPREKKHHSGRYAFRTRLHRGAGGVYPMRTARGGRFAGSCKEARQLLCTLHRGVALLARGRYLPAQGRCFHNQNNRGTFGIRSAMAFLGDQPENPTEPHEEAGGGAIPAAAHDPRDGARSPRRRAIPAPRTAPAMGARTPTDASAGSRSAVRCCGAAAAAA